MRPDMLSLTLQQLDRFAKTGHRVGPAPVALSQTMPAFDFDGLLCDKAHAVIQFFTWDDGVGSA